MKWVLLNKAFEALMVDNKIITSRKQAPGKPCSSAAANICKTPNCGVRQLERGIGESFFDWHGQKCKQTTRELKDRTGALVGYVEVVQDLSPVLSVQEYTAKGVSAVLKNLSKLAAGDLSFDLSLPKVNEHTKSVHESFEKINADMSQVGQAVRRVIDDATLLTQAAAEGRLATRAEAGRHQGDFKKIVEGVNLILDVVIGPLNEAAAVVGRIAKGDLTSRMIGNYQGDLAMMKQSINTMAIDLSGAMASIAKNAEDVALASDTLTTVSRQLLTSSETTAAQSNAVSRVSGEVSNNVATVASGAVEMSASIKEIAANATAAAQAAAEAVKTTEETTTTIGKLGKSSDEIGKVIKVITSIAEQTKLLALNATEVDPNFRTRS